MMSEVVEFPIVEARIWICLCGCSTFKLIEDGSKVCSACNLWSHDGSWYDDKPDGGNCAANVFSDVQGNGSVDFAMAQIRRMACEPDTEMMVIAKTDGRVKAWFNFSSEEEQGWMRKRLDDARDLLDGLKP